MRDPCAVGALPPVASVSLDQVLSLRAGLLEMIAPLGGQREAGGITTPVLIWLGNLPRRLRPSRLPGGLWPGGYELRQWAGDGDFIVADALLFAHPDQARGYFDQAGDFRCNGTTTQSVAHRPPGARNLISLEFARYAGYRVLFSSGLRVYRVIDWRPRRVGVRSSSAEQDLGVSAVDDLACALLEAGCQAPTG
jgi:hypothetical protein